jgi:hypothetical protein
MHKEGDGMVEVINSKGVGLRGENSSLFMKRKIQALGQIIKDHSPVTRQ